jgi:hypothetical protein
MEAGKPTTLPVISTVAEVSMSVLDQSTVYDDLVEMLAESADPVRVLAFRLSDEKQSRLDGLLEKNRQGTLSSEETAELDAFEHFEHVVRMLKASVRRKESS